MIRSEEGGPAGREGADRFWQGEGRKILGLHEAAEDALDGLLRAVEFGLYDF